MENLTSGERTRPIMRLTGAMLTKGGNIEEVGGEARYDERDGEAPAS